MALHVGDVGAIIRLTSDTDLSSQTTLTIKYRKPDGTTGAWDASLNGTTNVQYTTTAAGDLDVPGDWTFQAYAVITGFTGHSTSVTKEVNRAILTA